MASSRTSRLKACGVCARYIDSRAIVRATILTPGAAVASFTVSLACTAAIAAPPLAAASMTRENRSAVANGLAASWMTITVALFETWANAFATESCRRSPPLTMRTGFFDEIRYGGGDCARSGGSAITISSIRSWPSTSAKLRSRMVRSPSAIICLGIAAPSRVPRPAAARMADTYTRELYERRGSMAVSS